MAPAWKSAPGGPPAAPRPCKAAPRAAPVAPPAHPAHDRLRCRAQAEGDATRSELLRQGLSVLPAAALASQLGRQAAQAQPDLQIMGPGQVAMRTLPGSELAIGFYPRFTYDSSGGGGLAQATHNGHSKRLELVFDPVAVEIPDVTAQTTRFLGIPLLPGLRIAIQPTKLEGFLDPETGEVMLEFDAQFRFNAASLYKAPPLLVRTKLTTEGVKSRHHSRRGRRLDKDGRATLVAVAEVKPTGDALLDNFLQLPTDVLAVMQSQFRWQA